MERLRAEATSSRAVCRSRTGSWLAVTRHEYPSSEGFPEAAPSTAVSSPGHDPVVSVTISYFDQPAYLAECVQSACAQTYGALDILVVDDASPAPTAQAVLHEAGLVDPRLRIIPHEANRGLGAARNTGFRAAYGDLIAAVDADDSLHPAFVERLARVLREHRAVDCAFADLQLFGGAYGVRRLGVHPNTELLRRQWIPGAGVLMRRQLWLDVGGYAEHELFRGGDEDWDFWLGAAEVGFRSLHIPEPLYFYRVHASSMSATTLSTNAAAARGLMYRRHRVLFDQHGGAKAFLADGLNRSATAEAHRGHRLRAFRLLLRSWRIAPGNRATIRAAVSLLPGIRAIKSRLAMRHQVPF